MLAHVFLAAPGSDARTAWKRLRSLWHRVTHQFGLDSPILMLTDNQHLPLEPARSDSGPVVLAAAESSKSEVWQALAWADHDVLCLTAMIAPPRDQDCASAWADLERAWEEATADLAPNGVLGEARIFLALLGRPPSVGRPTGDTAHADVLGLVRAAVPEPSHGGWWRHWDTVQLPLRDAGSGGVLVWEIGPESGNAGVLRRLVAVAPAEFERQVDQLLWTSGDGTPTPLSRHLMHAARLRYQLRVFDDGSSSRRLRDELGLDVDDPPGAAADRGRLSARLEQAEGSAVTLTARLGAMRDSVAIIDENLRQALSLPTGTPAVGPLTGDLALASWFGVRLGDEISRLEAAVTQARSARDFLAEEGLASVSPLGRPRPAVLDAASPQHRDRLEAQWVVVFTAIEAEYTAVREHLAGPIRNHEERGTLYELGSLPDVRGSWQVAITQTGPGNTPAGVQLERAIPVFSPAIVLFLGVAGGRKDVVLGDVVVADTIYDYEWGKSTREGYLPRMRTHRPTFSLVQRARQVARENRWQHRILPACPQRPPAAFVKPIVAGSKVVAHDRSAVALLVDQYASDALAVETEGHGFLEGAYMNPEVDAIVIRGISDLLAGKDTASDEYWQPAASRHAAAFAVELLDSIGSGQS
jgi:nucleoside phosphorylase